jgi:sulfite reductase (NADPH) flavoprotein alpha-component
MFTYFGYGSNMDLVALRAKGVEPVSSTRAVLRGWRLVFDVRHWFRHEGGVGNIRHTGDPGDVVEGVVHLCPDEHLAPLDALEAYGVGYDRIVIYPLTDQGEVEAYTYVGLPDALDDSCLPSRRYLNILIRGAEKAGLRKGYTDWLRHHPVHIPDEYPDFAIPDQPDDVYTPETLAQNPHLTALAGAVFDMRGVRPQLQVLHGLFGGRDMTLFLLKRLDTSDGTETAEDVRAGRISPAGKRYLNAYLHEYAREFRFAGRYVENENP